MGFYNQIADAEPEGSPFVARAEQAARAGDMASLEKMAQQEPYRKYARSKGADPDAWDTQQQLQAQLKDLLERQSIETLSGPKAAAAAATAKAEQDARLPGEKELKLAPSWQAPPQYEPLSRIAARTELVQSIEDKHAAARAAATASAGGIIGKVQRMRDGTWALIRPADAAHPKAWADPIDGQPAADGKLLYFTKDEQRYVQNADHPELGAIPVPVHEAGEKGAPDIATIRAGKVAPPPPDSPDASLAATLHRLNSPTPAPAASSTQKLNALAAGNPDLAAKIKTARAHRISDDAIAAHLGL
jgi:hypothetical protein